MSERDGYFGEDVAATYDSAASDMFGDDTVGPTVDVLAQLAGDGRALEFGVGTGRIALPLARRGIEVHGIDLSRAARIAGLVLTQRWGDWDGLPFTHESTRHVSVWQKPGSREDVHP